MKKITLVAFSIVLFGAVIFYYTSVFERTAAVVLITEKTEKTIVVKFENGEQQKVNAPKKLIPLLMVNHHYQVNIYKNNFRHPFLHDFTPIEELDK